MLVFLLLCILFFIVPGRNGWFDGIPLSQFHELFFLTLLISIFVFFLPQFKNIQKKHFPILRLASYAILLIIIIKILLGVISLPKGLMGYYYQPSIENGVLQRSTEFINTKIDGTRIDEEINFENIGYSFHAKPFQFWFLNNNTKFNNPNIGSHAIPISVAWKGHIYNPKLDALKIDLSTDNGAKLYINKDKVLDIQGSDQLSVQKNNKHIELNVNDKLIPIELIYYRGQGTTQFLKLSILNTRLFPQKYSDFQIYSDGILNFIDNFIKILVLVIILAILLLLIYQNNWKEWFYSLRFYIFISFLLSFGLLIKKLLNKVNSEYFNVLHAGNDPLTYETFARHIQLTGNWSMSALETGYGYYYQILYYHALVIAHYLMGESIFPIIFFQLISVLLTTLLVVWICKLFIKKDSLIFPLLLVLIALNSVMLEQAFQMFPIGTLLIVLVPLFLFLAEKNIEDKRVGALICFFIAGIFLGLSIVMRNNAVAMTLVILLWFIFSFKKLFLAPFIIFVTGTILPLIPFIIRNKLLVNQFTLISKSAITVNFIQANPVPSNYISSGENYDTIMNFAGIFFDSRAFLSIQWMLEQPLNYLKLVAQRLFYFLGFNSSEATLWLSIPFILFFVCSTLFIIKPNLFYKTIKRKDYLITGGFAWTHLITIVFFAVGQRRHSVPLMPFLLFFSCLLIIPLFKIFLKLLPLRFRSNYLENLREFL